MILMSIILKEIEIDIYIYIYNERKGKERIREKKRDIIITTYLLPPSPIPQKTNIEVILCDLFALYKRITRIKD